MSDNKTKSRTTTKQLAEQLQQTRTELTELRAQLERGLRFCHVITTNNQAAVHDTQATLNGLGHVLASKQKVAPAEVQQARDGYAAAMPRPEFRARVGAAEDKYSAEAKTVQIDCEARWSLCRAACCRLGYVLGIQDLEERAARWDYGNPYVILKDANGWCTHLQQGCKCSIREQRPLSCRRYDCRHNADIWIDFERRIANPQVAALPPIERPE